MAATTKHTCGGPVFGRLTKGCPRCDELADGAEPVRWNKPYVEPATEFRARLEAHNCQAHGCGPVCVAFDW